jgi:hypothetical protein
MSSNNAIPAPSLDPDTGIVARLRTALDPVTHAASDVRERIERVPRGYLAVVALGILIATLVTALLLLPTIQIQFGEDYKFFMAIADRWRSGQSVYLPLQLAGPYTEMSGRDMIYPPPALWLFVVMSFLPAFLWWVIPLGVVAAVTLWYKPEPWTWIPLAIAVAYPRTQSMLIWGNTGMWIAAFVALGLVWGWPGILVLIKPSLAPLALVGLKARRASLIALAVFAVLNIPLIPLWFDFVTVVRNAGSTWPSLLYSVPDVPLALMPVIAWLGSGRRRTTAVAATSIAGSSLQSEAATG